ncbi:hypothetical protein [Actinomadura hibisca]|uniref:hypothetical protein n=1 Tax=Actinomadura hibisca TaxID=68565 RepID=UPI00082D3D62|nr:hypothetical protein [Actinomadura hibisca]
MNAAETRPIALTVGDWHTLLICISDETDGAIVRGDPRGIVGLADSIRDTVAAHVRDGWHTPDKPVTVALTLDQSALAFALLDKWADIDEQRGHHDDAAEQRHIRDRIGATMATVPEWPQTRDGFLDPDTVHNYPAPEPDLTGMPPTHSGADRGVPAGSRGRIPAATAHLYEPAAEPDSRDIAEVVAHPYEPAASDTVKEPWIAALEDLIRQRQQES